MNDIYIKMLKRWVDGTLTITQLDRLTKYTFNKNFTELLKYIRSNFSGDTTTLDDILSNIYKVFKDDHINFDAVWAGGWKDFFNSIDTSMLPEIAYTNKIYKHGFGGIIDNQEKIKPTNWYDKQHPFEFEVIVNDTPYAHKIFNNMRLMSNKAKPESFHYEIIGECYEFAPDKLNGYYRQEAKKNLFRNMGSNICYNEDYKDLKEYTHKSPKSVSFPLYYERDDTDQRTEDDYLALDGTTEGKDYSYLSGTEIIRYDKLNEFRLQEHDKAVDMRDSGRVRGNMMYLEDFWNIQINPMILVEKNETWKGEHRVPLDIFNSKIPNDLTTTQLSDFNLPENYNIFNVDLNSWSKRREFKLKDKWIKIRIRYSGEDLALIQALNTMYAISYA